MIGRTLGPYRIVSRLGAGGMGDVFLADDVRLGRRVAIKLLPVNLTSDPERLHRFELEARTASGLNHPNIVSVFDIGQSDAGHFIATELVEGQTLRARMMGVLPVETAVDIAAQMAAALGAAHDAGVIHRDVKPENIMIRPDGYAKLLDFGVAKLTEPVSRESSDAPTFAAQLTETGMIVGTRRYMSPEQARGLRVDSRSDLYSLGLVLHEMVEATTPMPAELERIVGKALQQNPEKRYQSARDLELDLEAFAHRSGSGASDSTAQRRRHWRRAAIGAAALAVAIAILFLASRWRGAPIDSIAVLPFVNTALDPDTEYLSDGISYSVLDRLGRIPALRVASFNGASRFKGKAVDVVAVGRDLKVAAVLTGRMTATREGYSFNVELVDARDARRLWGNSYEGRRAADLPAMQEDIVRELTRVMRVQLTSTDAERISRRETMDAEAYRLYLQGRFAWNRVTEAGHRESINLFQQAAARDPNYALAYSGMADAYSLLGELGFAAPKDVLPQARLFADKALALDNGLAEAYVSRAIVELFHDHEWAAAERDLRHAKNLKPNGADAYHFYGHYLQITGDTAAAVIETKRGLDLDPTSLLIQSEYAWALGLAGRADESLAAARKTLALDPNFFYASYVVAQAYVRMGRHAEVIAECNRVLAPSGQWSFLVAELGYAHAKLGQRAEAERQLRELESRASRAYVDAFFVAQIHLALGDLDATFRWLDRAYTERSGTLPWIKVDPHFGAIRGDARYAALVRRMGLAN